jgi:hypothetical protein
MDAKKVVETIFKYLESNMVPGMSGLQEIAFYAVREAVDDEAEALIETIKAKPLARAIVAIDKDGNVDVEKLASRVRKGIEAKGSLTIDIPLYGNICFVPSDIDKILSDLKEVERNENYQIAGRAY